MLSRPSQAASIYLRRHMHLVLCMTCRENVKSARQHQRQSQRGRSQDTLTDDKDRSRGARTGVAGDDLQRSKTTPLPQAAAAAAAAAAGDRRGDQDRAEERRDGRRERGTSGGVATPGGRESSGGEMSSLATAPALGGKGTGVDAPRQRRSTLSASESDDLSSEHGARATAGAAPAAAAPGAVEGGALAAASAGKARPQSRRGENAQRKE